MLRTKLLTAVLTGSIKNLNASNVKFTRTLYSAEAMGMDRFMYVREKTKLQVTNVDNFKAKMWEFINEETSNNLIFTEDLKNMLHISEQPDVELLTKMIDKFSTQSREGRFGNFIFGPPLMRVFYYLKDPDTALKLFNNSMDGFFDQLITYQILMDLLYENGRYQDVLNTFDTIKSRQVQGGRYPKNVVVLTFAACYKLNTPEAFDYACNLWKEASGSGHIPMRRAITFLAALALNQDVPHVALEVISNVKQQNYLTVRTIKALALAKLKRYDDVLPILRSVLEVTSPMTTKQTFPARAIEQINKEFEENTNKDSQADFKKIISFLDKHGHITQNSLDDILCSEIQHVQFVPQNFKAGDGSQGYERRDGSQGYERRDGSQGYERHERYDSRRPQHRNFDDSSRQTRRPGLNELN